MRSIVWEVNVRQVVLYLGMRGVYISSRTSKGKTESFLAVLVSEWLVLAI